MPALFRILKENSRTDWAVLFIGLLTMLFLMAGSSLGKKLSYDEYPNLYYGYSFLTEGPLAKPDGQRMPILALNALACKASACDSEVLDHSEALRFKVRLPSMLFALLTSALAWLWARNLWGRNAGFLALGLCVFNPNLIAHGKQVTSDLATTFLALLCVFLFSKFLLKPSIKRASLFIACFSGCLISKYSGLILIPVFLIMALLRFVKTKSKIPQNPSIYIRAGIVVLASGAAVLFIINAVYLFQGSFQKASDYSWLSRKYQKHYGHSSLLVPLPRIYAEGLDYTQYISENPHIGRGNNYILGKRHRRGRWYAFPVMILLKTPLAFFAILSLGLFSLKKGEGEAGWILGISFLIWLIVFSVACDLQLGIRYVLPALPFLFILASRAAASGSPGIRAASLLLMIWYAGSSLSYYPHSMSYFNELIGSRINAYKYLSDSNLDWEDKTRSIEKFRQDHPEINFELDPQKPRPGFMVLGANHFTGVLDENMFQWVRDSLKPIRHIDYSHYLFYVPDDLAKKITQTP